MAFAYPVSLEVGGRRAVVIGEEAVRVGKAEALLDAGAVVTVIAEGPARRLDALELRGVEVRRRAYVSGDLAGAFVCVASTDDPATAAAIHAEGRRGGVLVNVMDDVPHCDFAAPAVVRRGDLAIAISTGGRSPALARRLREDLERQYGPEWAALLHVIGDVRAHTLAALPDLGERIRAWARALDPEALLTLVREGRDGEAREVLTAALLAGGSPTGADADAVDRLAAPDASPFEAAAAR